MVSESAYMITAAMAANQRDVVALYEAKLQECFDSLAAFDIALKTELCKTAGLQKELDAYKAKHPDSSMHTPTNMKFQDGTPKTLGRVLYEIGFDEKGKALGIENPAQIREN